jgi:uncharacterized protein involved in exopolysaccharide biosynthesis/Mrp family chromosome partitioning ATPase
MFGVFMRRKFLVAVVCAGIFLPAILLIATMRPYYLSAAQLIIGERQASFHDLQATEDQPFVDAVAVNTQVGILRSDTVALDVTRQLKLVDNPEFEQAVDAVPLKIRIREFIMRLMGKPVLNIPLTPSQRERATANVLGGKVTVVNDGRSYVITIVAKTGDGQLGADIANAYANDYIDFKRRLKVVAIRRANSLLDEQVAPLRDRLRAAEQAVEKFHEQHNLVSLPSDNENANASGSPVTVVSQQLSQMNAQLVAAEALQAEKQAQYDQVMAGVRRGNSANMPQAVASPLIQQLQSQETQVSARIASLSTTAMDNNPDLVAARAEEARIRARIGQETGNLAGSVARELEAATSQVRTLQNAMAGLQAKFTTESQAAVSLHELEAEAAAARAVYQDYLGRLTQTSSQATLQEADANLIAAASTPLGAAGPPRMQYAAIALVLGLVIGCGVALLVDRLSAGIDNISQLESLPQLFGLGVVTAFRGKFRQQYEDPPNWRYVEMVETIRSILRFGPERLRAKVILVTSPEAGDGKTTFALSLAANTGRSGARALVIDCDLRNPSVLRVADAPARIGANRPVLAKTVHGEPVGIEMNVLPGVDVLDFRKYGKGGGGSAPDTVKLGELIARMRPDYDTIILDTPPLRTFPDAAMMGPLADGVILVVKAQRTALSATREVLRTLRIYNAHVLGGVITQVRERDLSPAYGAYGAVYRLRASKQLNVG